MEFLEFLDNEKSKVDFIGSGEREKVWNQNEGMNLDTFFPPPFFFIFYFFYLFAFLFLY